MKLLDRKHPGTPLLACVVLTMLGGCAAPTPVIENTEVLNGREAILLLREGNQRFVEGRSIHNHESPARRDFLASGQDPFGIVLGCSDSRVPPELIFDVGLGDLFVIRVAGNVAGKSEVGSIAYSIQHLHTPVVVVLGHEGCGAVSAALGSDHSNEPMELQHLLKVVQPAFKDIDEGLPMADRIHLGVEANVRQSVRKLREIQQRVGKPEPHCLIVGAVYELETGRARILD